MQKKNVIVGQSGGPTAVINASLYGVVYEALNREDTLGTVYGMINGIEGFLHDQIMDMKPLEQSGELGLIKTTPGSYLGSCRYKLPEDLNDPVYPELFEKFAAKNIGYFFYIGGNDSMDTVSFPAMRKRSKATSGSSESRKRSTTISCSPIIRRDSEAPQNMLRPPFVRSPSTHPFTTTKNP